MVFYALAKFCQRYLHHHAKLFDAKKLSSYAGENTSDVHVVNDHDELMSLLRQMRITCMIPVLYH